MSNSVKTFKIVLAGRVQGVGFRYFTESRASKYAIRGYVRNRPDGKVEIVCQGNSKDLDQFIEEVKKGPSFAGVTDINIEKVENPRNYNSFEIKF
ncbi:MAG: acylphosphatase [Actinomycetota bacterium]